MILLDTNVISALMLRNPDPTAVAWVNSQPPESIWTTTITVFEIRFGLERLVPSHRRRFLEETFRKSLAEDLAGRIVPFDERAALAAGRIAAERQRIGRTIEFRDILIAGIGATRKAAIATRNVRHFEGLGIVVVNPWSV